MSIMNRLNVLIDQDYEGNEATFNFFTRGGRKKMTVKSKCSSFIVGENRISKFE